MKYIITLVLCCIASTAHADCVPWPDFGAVGGSLTVGRMSCKEGSSEEAAAIAKDKMQALEWSHMIHEFASGAAKSQSTPDCPLGTITLDVGDKFYCVRRLTEADWKRDYGLLKGVQGASNSMGRMPPCASDWCAVPPGEYTTFSNGASNMMPRIVYPPSSSEIATWGSGVPED